jgi:hypothetical protein
VLRSTTGGDETLLFVFNPSPEETAKITSLVQNLNLSSQEVTVTSKKGPQKFLLSSSVGLISNVEPRFINQTATTLGALRSNEIRLAYDLFNDMVDLADNRAGALKVLHELSQMDLDKLLSLSPDEYRIFLMNQIGGSRVSKAGINIYTMIDQIITARHFSTKAKNDSVSIEPTITEITTFDPGSAITLKKIVETYRRLFPPSST